MMPAVRKESREFPSFIRAYIGCIIASLELQRWINEIATSLRDSVIQTRYGDNTGIITSRP